MGIVGKVAFAALRVRREGHMSGVVQGGSGVFDDEELVVGTAVG